MRDIFFNCIRHRSQRLVSTVVRIVAIIRRDMTQTPKLEFYLSTHLQLLSWPNPAGDAAPASNGVLPAFLPAASSCNWPRPT